jgi:two-component system response regulator VicR
LNIAKKLLLRRALCSLQAPLIRLLCKKIKIMKKILLIEDEEIMIDLLQKKLAREGYEISVARDGEEGLKAVKELKPDLVLLDIVMPKMSGLEVMEEIAKDRELKKIPIIVVSNSGQPVELDRAQKLGAKDWLVKTEFDPQEVIDKVVRQIGR